MPQTNAPRIGVVTVATPNIMSYAKYTLEVNKAYCDKHNYDFYVYRESIRPTRHPVWSKIPALMNHMKDHDYLMWIDADAMIINHDKNISDVIDGTHEIFVNKDVNGLNAGIFILKCSPRTQKMLETMDSRDMYGKFEKSRFREQDCMAFVLNTPGYREATLYVDPKKINNYDDIYPQHRNMPNIYTTGDFILHLPGAPEDYRETRFKQLRDKLNEMIPVISDLNSKKLVDYLKPGVKVLIKYPHGLGDVIMFIPYVNQLKQMFPESVIDVQVTPDKAYLLPEPKEARYYDHIFEFKAHFNERYHKDKTKPECNCEFDLGIPYDNSLEYTWEPPVYGGSPFVAVHFNSTCYPKEINCNYGYAKTLWAVIRSQGFIPIDLHAFHTNIKNNEANKAYDFVTRELRDCPPNLNNILWILKHCAGYAGVCTGTFHMAMTMFPDKVLFLKNQFEYTYFGTSRKILSVDTNRPFDTATVAAWVSRLKGRNDA